MIEFELVLEHEVNHNLVSLVVLLAQLVRQQGLEVVGQVLVVDLVEHLLHLVQVLLVVGFELELLVLLGFILALVHRLYLIFELVQAYLVLLLVLNVFPCLEAELVLSALIHRLEKLKGELSHTVGHPSFLLRLPLLL